jgi:ABC-type sugar transport system permease subunit
MSRSLPLSSASSEALSARFSPRLAGSASLSGRWARLRTEPALAPWLFLSPFLLTFTLFVAWPLVQALPMAFQQNYGPRTSVWVGWDNFVFLLQDPMFWLAAKNTGYFAVGSLLVQLPISLGLAMLVNLPGVRGRALFRVVLFSPSLVGLVFVGMIFHLLLAPHTGLVNSSLHALTSAFDPEFPWLKQYTMAALLLSATWLYAGFNMIYFLAALQQVPNELLEAAALDGAGAWQRFRHIVLPSIMPVASFVVLMSLLGSLQLFELSFILAESTSGYESRGLTIVFYLYQKGFVTGDLGYASAIGWVLSLCMGLVALGQRWLVRQPDEN